MRTILKMIALSAGLMLSTGIQSALASSSIVPNSRELPATLLDMKLSEFIRLSATEFSNLAGKKMTFMEKVSFSLLKKDMKKSLKANPDQTVKDYLATTDKKKNTTLIIVIIAVVVFIGIIIAITAGPGSIGWGE